MNCFSRIVLKCSRLLLLVVCGLTITAGAVPAFAVDYKAMTIEELQKKIATFEIGLGPYVIGKKLTDAQRKIASANNQFKAYPGTIKFKDGEIFVIIDKDSNVVIATYTRNKKAKHEEFKATIGELMLIYGEPTAEAHGKTIYWNYGPDGLISEELYRTAKNSGRLDTLNVLATVKFSSSQHADVMSELGKKKEEKGTEKALQEVFSDNYVMIQSDLLSMKYMGN